MVSPALRGLAFPIPDDVLQALRKRDFATAAAGLKKIDPNTLPGPHKGDWAFVLSYSLARSGKAAPMRCPTWS
jgi:hypothetical protein